MPIVWPCVGLLLAPRKVWIGRNQRDGYSLNEDALLSRLRAACADADGVKGSMKDDTAKLARKFMDDAPRYWVRFSEKYDMLSHYKTGTFFDVKEMVIVLTEAERSKDPGSLHLVAGI